MTDRTHVLTRSLDRIHARIAAGDASGGVLQLACMLDTALIDRAEATRFKGLLADHPITACLAAPGVRQAIAQLDPLRALAGREEQVRREAELAWQRGLTCLLIGSAALHALDRLAGRDLSNVTRLPDPSGLDRLVPGGTHDLILAPDLLDHTAHDGLPALIARLGAAVQGGGRVVLSAFVADHTGHGWREMFFGPPVHSHAAPDLIAAARAAGLRARLFDDATGCLVWAELRPDPAVHDPGGEG